MKKFLIQLLLVSILGFSIGLLMRPYLYKEEVRPFEFRGGLSISGGGYARSTSRVVVNETDYEIEDLYTRIYDQYVLMNGQPDELTFYLYDSIESLEEDRYFSSRLYLK